MVSIRSALGVTGGRLTIFICGTNDDLDQGEGHSARGLLDGRYVLPAVCGSRGSVCTRIVDYQDQEIASSRPDEVFYDLPPQPLWSHLIACAYHKAAP